MFGRVPSGALLTVLAVVACATTAAPALAAPPAAPVDVVVSPSASTAATQVDVAWRVCPTDGPTGCTSGVSAENPARVPPAVSLPGTGPCGYGAFSTASVWLEDAAGNGDPTATNPIVVPPIPACVPPPPNGDPPPGQPPARGRATVRIGTTLTGPARHRRATVRVSTASTHTTGAVTVAIRVTRGSSVLRTVIRTLRLRAGRPPVLRLAVHPRATRLTLRAHYAGDAAHVPASALARVAVPRG